MLFVTILVDLTLVRVNLDIQEMAKIALVSYALKKKYKITTTQKEFTRTIKFIIKH